MSAAPRDYPDLHEHLAALEERGLLQRIDRPIDKDAEMHPLVRWQFVGGIDEAARKAFLFTNIVDGLGRTYDIPVVVGAIAANRAKFTASACVRRSRTSRPNGTMPSPIRSRRALVNECGVP